MPAYLLCCVESEFKIVSAIFRVQNRVIERFRKEIVDQRTESQTVRPTAGKVVDINILKKNTVNFIDFPTTKIILLISLKLN